MVQSIKRILFGMVLAFLTLFAAPGDLDVTFGTGGKVTTDFNNYYDEGKSVTLQSDGKIVVAGYTYIAGVGSNFALARYDTNGSLDTTFGNGGKVTTDFNGSNAQGFSVALQSDGKIVVAGQAAANFALARYDTNGFLDTTFGNGGKVTTDFNGSNAQGLSVALQSDGKIVVAGYTYIVGVGSNFALARYDTNGALDTTFGSSGKVTTDFNGYDDFSNSVAIQSDGKIVVAGYTYVLGEWYNFALARYDTNGSLDTTFGSGGKVTTDFASISSIYDQGLSVALQSDGNIVVAGLTVAPGEYYNFTLARYDTNGALDTTFGSGGKVMADFNISYDIGWSVSIQNNGKIVVAGYSDVPGEDRNFALARYDTNGSLDTTFGSGGKVTTDFYGSNDYGYSVAIQNNGKIVVAGFAYVPGGYPNFALARYEGDPTEMPEIDVSPVSLEYSDVIIGNAKELNVTVSNIGTAELIVNGVSIAGANETEFSQTHDCAAVAVESSCTIDVTFTPVTTGAKTATLSIDSDDADEATVNVPLTANAISPQEFADNIGTFIESSVESGELEGTGSGRSATRQVDAVVNMIMKAKELIDSGDITGACDQLESTYKKIDGDNRPPDLVSGSDAEELANMIEELQQSLGC